MDRLGITKCSCILKMHIEMCKHKAWLLCSHQGLFTTLCCSMLWDFNSKHGCVFMTIFWREGVTKVYIGDSVAIFNVHHTLCLGTVFGDMTVALVGCFTQTNSKEHDRSHSRLLKISYADIHVINFIQWLVTHAMQLLSQSHYALD